MKPKNIPILALSLLSILICLGAVVLMFSLAVDAKTVGEKLQASLSLGLPFAILLIVLVWLGAGVDHLLARIQDKTRRLWVSLGVYVFGPFIFCIVLPALVIVLFANSLFPAVTWQELPATSSTPLEIVSVGDSSITVQVGLGDYLYCWVPTPENCWQPTTEIQERIVQNSIGNVEETTTAPTLPLAGDVKQRISVRYFDTGVEVFVHYVILNDGSVWYLEENADEYETGFLTGLAGSLAILPAVAGLLVIYLGAGVSAIARRFTKRVDESTPQT